MNRDGRLRIILLEDDASLRGVMTELLTLRGHEVHAFSDPTICPLQAWPACRCAPNQSCADVILTDLAMPGMDGLQFVENLKRKNCKCRYVAVMSGVLREADKAKAEQLGCSIFSKPFNPRVFFEWLEGIRRIVDPARKLCNWFREPPEPA